MSIGINGAGEEVLKQHPLLNTLEVKLEEITSMWNGEDDGSLEDIAHCADEALQKIKELKELLEEINITY